MLPKPLYCLPHLWFCGDIRVIGNYDSPSLEGYAIEVGQNCNPAQRILPFEAPDPNQVRRTKAMTSQRIALLNAFGKP